MTQSASATQAFASAKTKYTISFRDIGLDDLPRVGGKNASLGEMIRELGSLGVRVPDGFAVTADAFQLHLKAAGLSEWVYSQLDNLDITDTAALAETAKTIRHRIAKAPLPGVVRDQVLVAYAQLCSDCDAKQKESRTFEPSPDVDVAVRSSATAEDLPTASFAGQQETYLNVVGINALCDAIASCMASLFTDRAIVYRVQNNFDHRSLSLSVGVQRMVRSDLACSGTMFTLDTETGFTGVVLIDASWGLGETIVQGRVNPDEIWIHKATARQGFHSVIRKVLGEKNVKLVYASQGGNVAHNLRELPVVPADRARFAISDIEALTLARWAMMVEDHYSRRAGREVPMDLEWAKDGTTGDLFILQARPETVQSQRISKSRLTSFRISKDGEILVTGKSVGNRIGSGRVRIVRSTADLPDFRDGDVLVADMTDPDWEPVLRKAAAVVTDHGGRTCHAAIVSREMGLPCIVGTSNATTKLKDGQYVTVSCAQGDIGKVYAGQVPFQREEIDIAALPVSSVPLMLNLADPARAFELCQLPAAGVGLMRIEFLVSKWIGIHPMALVHPERISSPAIRSEIRDRAAAYPTPAEFFIDRLASGVGQIGAAFYPRQVIVRFSDFKTNEYAGLLGGEAFEPKEENPMIGFRGASRYYDDRYREGFALECAAIRRVRETMGLANVIVMIPFCRTLKEAHLVLAEMEKNGLTRGKDMLVYVMCEIPNNVILAEEFCDLFDGFSIGSNDLTQLTLGVDRDSDLLSHIFDERDPGVKKMIEIVVAKAHKKEKKVGICGEAPSNYPDFAQWLASIGIDSMSLNPDSLPGVARQLAQSNPASH